MYDEMIVAPMRAELARLGIQETKTAAEVDSIGLLGSTGDTCTSPARSGGGPSRPQLAASEAERL